MWFSPLLLGSVRLPSVSPAIRCWNGLSPMSLRCLNSRHPRTFEISQRCNANFYMRNYVTRKGPASFWEEQRGRHKERNRSLLMYTSSVIIVFLGLTYAAVPLYRMFCSATGFAGTPMTGKGIFAPERLVPVTGTKKIKVHFNSDTSDALPWSFVPQQKYIYVLPGETALAFYKVKNKSDKDIIGIATYNVTPDKIAPYFAKVECFCFEEQKLLAGEEVDLPLLFFIDKDYIEDESMKNVDDVVLSYTFFKARRNKQGHLEPDASMSEVERSLGWTSYPSIKSHDETITK